MVYRTLLWDSSNLGVSNLILSMSPHFVIKDSSGPLQKTLRKSDGKKYYGSNSSLKPNMKQFVQRVKAPKIK